MVKSIRKVLSEGDMIYSSADGHPIKVTKVHSCGIETPEGYYSFDEHSERFFCTKEHIGM